MKQAPDYPKLEFVCTPRRAYFFTLTRFAILFQDFVPNPTLRQRGRKRDSNTTNLYIIYYFKYAWIYLSKYLQTYINRTENLGEEQKKLLEL